MTYEQLQVAAGQRAFVRWHPSGVIERLRRGRLGVVLAKNLYTGREHPLRPFPGQTEFFCEVVPPETPVSIGSILPK